MQKNQFYSAMLAALALILSSAVHARAPEGWPFSEYNDAAQMSRQMNKPMFVYFGFATCPYCLYANEHTFSSVALRKLYTDHYVLAYFDIRGNPADSITLTGGEVMTRAEAIKRLKGSPVPAWMFVAADGREILMRRGSRTKVDAFMQFDLYVTSGEYRKVSFEEFLWRRGLREEKVE